MKRSVDVDIKIPFHDVDVMQVAWHGHYAKYLEIARCKLLDSIEYNYPQMRDSGYAWPVVNLQIKYIRPLRFQQVIRVTATLVEWENRLRIQYQIADRDSGERLTTGMTDMVAVEIATEEMQWVSPPILWQKLGVSEAES